MADSTDTSKSIEVPTQNQEAEKAREQADAKGTFESEVKAAALTGEAARQQALKDEAAKGFIHGIPKDEYNKLDTKGQKRAQLNDPNSDLRNRITKQDEIDFLLLSNTNAYTVEAMTGENLESLGKRAQELGVTLKGSAAGDGGPR